MTSPRESLHGQWSSSTVFVLALAGSAVGLGNVWRFPSLVAEYGGGAFLLLYVLCLLALGMPLMVAEVVLGRRGRRNPVTTWRLIAEEEGRSALWCLVGWGGLIASLLLLSTYSVVGGWTLAYVFRSATGSFASLDVLQAAEVFQSLIRDPERLLAWHTIFMAVVMMIVARGVRWGLEEAVRWFMPMLLAILVLLTWIAASGGALVPALSVLLKPDFSALGLPAFLVALRHAFFTLSIGLGVIVAFSAYLSPRAPVLRLAAWAVVLDTLVAILAGVMVFAVLAANGLPFEWRSGPELIFQVLPRAFGNMATGIWFGTLFFLMLAFAAWTSAIALLEPAVAYLVERFELDRPLATSYAGTVVWALGVGSVLSFSLWQHVRPLAFVARFQDSTLFDAVNFVAANALLPVAGLGMAVFVGWRMSETTSRLELGGGRPYRAWRMSVRYVTPLAAAVVLLQSLGFLDY